MNKHLTSQQISEWVIGERSREVESHLRACLSCQEELGRFETSLQEFRHSVRGWSESHLPPSPILPQTRRSPARSWVMAFCWAAATIIVCILVGRLAYHPASPTQTAAADAALLAQIDHEVSQTVPDSMEPLTQLVSWDENSSAAKNSKLVRESQAQ